jgi:toxin YhaV
MRLLRCGTARAKAPKIWSGRCCAEGWRCSSIVWTCEEWRYSRANSRSFNSTKDDLDLRRDALDLLIDLTDWLGSEEEFLHYANAWQALTGKPHPLIDIGFEDDDLESETEILCKYERDIEDLRRDAPSYYVNRFKPRLLKKIQNAIRIVANDLYNPHFRFAKKLGKDHKNWRRVKGKGLPERYRLFFMFFDQYKQLVFAWLNDDTTLRTEGASTDSYKVFRSLLDRQEVPIKREQLNKESTHCKPEEFDPDPAIK